MQEAAKFMISTGNKLNKRNSYESQRNKLRN